MFLKKRDELHLTKPVITESKNKPAKYKHARFLLRFYVKGIQSPFEIMTQIALDKPVTANEFYEIREEVKKKYLTNIVKKKKLPESGVYIRDFDWDKVLSIEITRCQFL
ncbi:MAG: hypothetical protein AABY22_03165 [Nanoarchaeota archaeon]